MTEVLVYESDLVHTGWLVRERGRGGGGTHLFARGEEDDRLGEEVSLDETPQDVQLLIEFDDHVVLFEVLGRRLVHRPVSSLFSLVLAFTLTRRGDDSFPHGDVLGIAQGETSEVLDGLGLSGGEEERLAGFGEVGDDGVDGGGESHVEASICLVQNYIRGSSVYTGRGEREGREGRD